MKNYILIFSVLFFVACKPQKSVSTTSTAQSSVTIAKKGMKMFGKIVVKSKASGPRSETPVLYFDNGISYLINFSESNVTKSEVKKYSYKEIDILGEIKSGKVAVQSKDQSKEGATMKEGQYIVIYKIL